MHNLQKRACVIVIGVKAFGKNGRPGAPKSFGLMLYRGNFLKLFFSAILILAVLEIVLQAGEIKIDPSLLTFFATIGGTVLGSLDRSRSDSREDSSSINKDKDPNEY